LNGGGLKRPKYRIREINAKGRARRKRNRAKRGAGQPRKRTRAIRIVLKSTNGVTGGRINIAGGEGRRGTRIGKSNAANLGLRRRSQHGQDGGQGKFGKVHDIVISLAVNFLILKFAVQTRHFCLLLNIPEGRASVNKFFSPERWV
jgi:hypothetical protein